MRWPCLMQAPVAISGDVVLVANWMGFANRIIAAFHH